MYRPDNSTAAGSKPTRGAIGPNPDSFYQNETVVEFDHMNAITDELANLVESVTALDKADDTQVVTVIDAKVAAAVSEYQMKYNSDTVAVFTGPMPTTWTDLDLSSIVGTNRAFVVIAIDSDADSFVHIRKNGDTRRTYDQGGDGAGISGGSTTSVTRTYATMVTDVNGVIEWNAGTAGTTTNVYLVSYQKIFE